MKITKQELTRLLAEKVIGWKIDKNHGYYRDLPSASPVYACSVEDWNPLEDANHALQVLEAWCDNPKYDCAMRLNTSDRSIVIYDDETGLEYRAYSPNLNHAICLAVAEAETGVKYELVKE